MSVSCIDVHTHALPATYRAALSELGVSTFEEDGFPEPSWSEDDHVAFAEASQSFQILSISSPHLHKGDDAASARLCRNVNLELAAISARHPDAFGFAALLPLPAVGETIEEIAFGLDELGALSVKVPSNAYGVYFGDPTLDPVLEALDRRSAIVHIHPCAPQAIPTGVFTDGPRPLFEFLADTTRLVVNLITHRVPERFCHIRWIVPHAGSFLPEIAHRLMGVSQILSRQDLMEPADVQGSLASLYFDIAGNALPVMYPALLKVADPSHILYGSDYPYTPSHMISSARQDLERHFDATGDDAQAIFFGNAARLFGLEGLKDR